MVKVVMVKVVKVGITGVFFSKKKLFKYEKYNIFAVANIFMNERLTSGKRLC